MPGMDTTPSPGWRRDVFDVLKAHGVRHLAYVPDAGHATAIAMAEADPEIEATVLTTEEEGIGLLAGAWLGGQRGALLMQSSGVGNCINTLGLVASARFPFLTVVTMRGDWAEFNQHQNPMGQATEAALKLMGVMTWRADEPAQVRPLLHGAATMAFDAEGACALLLGQRLIGEKEWVK